MPPKRNLTLKIEKVSGTLNQIAAWLNGHPVIRSDGKDAEWTGNVPPSVTLETAVWGQGKAKYKLSIDLPGTADDQALELSLTDGYHDAEYHL